MASGAPPSSSGLKETEPHAATKTPRRKTICRARTGANVRRESVTTSSAPSSRAGLRRRSVHAVTRRSNIPRFGNPTPRLNPEADAHRRSASPRWRGPRPTASARVSAATPRPELAPPRAGPPRAGARRSAPSRRWITCCSGSGGQAISASSRIRVENVLGNPMLAENTIDSGAVSMDSRR